MLCTTALLVLSAIDAGVAAPLLPRALVLGNPEMASPQLAPDGSKFAFLKPDSTNVMQVFVRSGEQEFAVTTVSRGIPSFRWTEDSTAILFVQDTAGDEQFHVFVAELANRTARDLTPWSQTKNDVLETSSKATDSLLIVSNKRDAQFFDVWRLNWKSGATQIDTKNPGDVTNWLVDADLRVRGAVAILQNGGTQVRFRDTVKLPWKPLVTAGPEESIRVFGFSLDGKSLLMTTTISSDIERVIEKSLKTGTERLIATNPKSDVVDTLWNRNTFSLRGVAFEANGRKEWVPIESSFGVERDRLLALAPGEVDSVSSDRLESRWIVTISDATHPATYLLWDRKAQTAAKIGSAFPKLDPANLAPMTPVSIAARDGLMLQAFLTTPKSPGPFPLVLLIHEGPWEKDGLRFHPAAQWLANRGAAVLQVNFRGSTGYGKRFLNAGNRQWGLAMQDDVADAAAWAVAQGVADPAHVALMGQGYGGYATLMGLSKYPQRYACGVDFAGPSDLLTQLGALPPWLKTKQAMFFNRVGHAKESSGLRLLTDASVALLKNPIAVPLLIGHGTNDPRVELAQSRQLVSVVNSSNPSVSYAVYADEGHALTRLENRLDFAARTERLLGGCLKLRVESPTPSE